MTEAELKERLIRMESLLEFLAERTEDDRTIGRAREARLRKLEIKVHGTMAGAFLFMCGVGARLAGLI